MTKGARASTRDAHLREHDLVTGRNSCHSRQPCDERARRTREPPSASPANRADGQRKFRPRARRYPGPHRHRSRLRLASPPRPIAGSVQHTSPSLSENLGREQFDPTDDRGSFALLSARTYQYGRAICRRKCGRAVATFRMIFASPARRPGNLPTKSPVGQRAACSGRAASPRADQSRR
jgi:hypothetical protein